MSRRLGSLEVALRPRFRVLHGSPTGPEFQVQPLQFRTLVLERLRLPLILCREAGATVTRNVKLRDMNVQVPATDEREIGLWELVFQSNGAQDITQRSDLSWCTSDNCCHGQWCRIDTSSPGQRGQVRRTGEERMVSTCRCCVGKRWKVGHRGLGVCGRHGVFSGKDAQRFLRGGGQGHAPGRSVSLVVGQRDAGAGVDGSAPDLVDLHREG